MFLWLFLAACCLQFTLLGAANFSVGQTFQIILSAVPDLSKVLVPDVNVWDIDVWDSDMDTIKGLQRLGKIVVCYFSAGTYEPWRNDSNLFPASDIGLALDQWPNERWLNIKSSKIRDIMKTRIQMAAAKGCDAIDPDNTDVDQNKNGLNINRLDAIDYIKYLSSTAASLNLKIGLKNSLGILADVQDVVHFAVNEECAQMQECNSYDTFLSAQKKPVFHIEYPAKFPTVTTQERQLFCQAPGTAGMSTVIKNMTLDGWVMYCDGKTYNTSTSANGTNHWGWPPPGWPTPTTIPVPPTTTRRSTTTARTTTTRATTRTSSSIRTTSTPNPPNPPGGCTVAHWGQCGGQDYHGCTVCVSGTTCKPVSPPWYYQCL